MGRIWTSPLSISLYLDMVVTVCCGGIWCVFTVLKGKHAHARADCFLFDSLFHCGTLARCFSCHGVYRQIAFSQCAFLVTVDHVLSSETSALSTDPLRLARGLHVDCSSAQCRGVVCTTVVTSGNLLAALAPYPYLSYLIFRLRYAKTQWP